MLGSAPPPRRGRRRAPTRPLALLATVALCAAVWAALSALATWTRDAHAAALPEIAAAITERANALRATQGLPALERNPTLDAAAAALAAHMARTDQYGHEADGRTPAERVQAAGYAWCIVTENIAWERGTAATRLPERFLDGWARSPGHRRNLLDAAVTETGVAVAPATTPSARTYAVQVFALPRERATRFEIQNAAGVPVAYRLGDAVETLRPGVTRTHEVCRVEPLALDGEAARAWPKSGAVYRIERGDGALRLVGPG